MTDTQVPKTAFCHCFQFRDDWYAYDVSTNATYRIDEVLAHVLPIWGKLDDVQVIEHLKGQFTREQVQKAIAEIQEARVQDNLFLPCYPDEILPPEAKFETGDYLPLGVGCSLILSVTEQCNLRCRYCPYSNETSYFRSHSNQVMSAETAQSAVRLFHENTPSKAGTYTIGFYGGEPLLELDLVRETIQYARAHMPDKSIRFRVSTNGALLDDPDTVEFLSREKIHLLVSLDGPEEIHDHYRVSATGQGTFHKVIAGLRRLLTLDPMAARRTTLMVTLGPPADLLGAMEYYRDFPLYRELGLACPPVVKFNVANLKEIDIPEKAEFREEVWENEAKALSAYTEGCIALKRGEMNPFLAHRYDRQLMEYHDRDRRPMESTMVTTGICDPQGGNRLYVQSNGAMQVCEKVCDQFTIGNVHDGFDSVAVQRWFDNLGSVTRERCRTCWALRLCNLCFVVMTTDSTGEDDDQSSTLPESACQQLRNGIEATIQLYLELMEGNPKALDFLNESKTNVEV